MHDMGRLMTTCTFCGATEAPSACARRTCGLELEMFYGYQRACAATSQHPMSFARWQARRRAVLFGERQEPRVREGAIAAEARP